MENKKMIDGTRAVYHFLYVSEIAATRDFYANLVGLPILESEERAVKFDTGEIMLALNLASDFSIELTGERDKSQLIVFHTEAIDEKRAELEGLGVVFSGATLRYEIGATATFYDPDGHCILLYEPSEESLTWPSGTKVRSVVESAKKSSQGPCLLYIFDYITSKDAADEFYSARLGMATLERDDGPGVVKYDAGGILLATHLVESQFNASKLSDMALPRSTALVFGCTDINSVAERLRGAGVIFDSDVRFGSIGGTASFRAPDGHRFYLYQPSEEALASPSGEKLREWLSLP
jgi:predicted enzyme related to lactoylglutathione lyase